MYSLIINPIRIYGVGEVFITIEYRENGRLSITGVEGPMSNGNCRGSAGQINMSLRSSSRRDWTYNKPWNGEMMDRLLDIWDRWHLNYMHAGTPQQEAFIREWKRWNRYDYLDACKALDDAGLIVNRGHRYGHGWLTEEVPHDVLDWLFSLPPSTKVPAWS